MDDSDSGFGGGMGGGYGSDTGSLGNGFSGGIGSSLGYSGNNFGPSYSGGGGSDFGYTDNVGLPTDSFSYDTSFGTPSAGFDAFSLGDVYSQASSPGLAETNYSTVPRDTDWWDSDMGKFVKSIGKFALSTNPVGRAGLTAYGLYNAAQNKDYGALAQGLVGTATGNGLLGSVAGIGTNMAMGKDVRGQVGSTLGGLVGGGIAGPVGGMVGSQMGRSVATSDRAPIGGGYADRSMSGGGSGGRSGLDAGQLMAGLGNLYLNNKAARGAEGNVQSLSSMFGPKSAYAQQLRQQLERRDAAGGRRSQYGPREVELQAKLAQMAAQYGPNISQSNMNAQQVANQRRQQNLSSLYAMARESGLMDQFSSGLNNLFSSNNSPSLYFDSNTSGDVYSV
jgi:hypothetical protein